MFPTLRAEMARHNIKTKDIAETLNVTIKTARDKIRGKYNFTHPEMKKIRDKFFPYITIDELFYTDRTA